MRCWAKDSLVLNEYDAAQLAACYRALWGRTRFLELMRHSAAQRLERHTVTPADLKIALVFLNAPHRGRMGAA